LTDIICPRAIIRASDQKTDNRPAVVPLPPYENTANISNIVCSSQEAVLLRLLVCKELREGNNQDECPFLEPPYTDHKIVEAIEQQQLCKRPIEKIFTQIYFRRDKTDEKTRSYVIVFIEGINLHITDELLKKFQNTVECLKIAEEKPFYYIVYYGELLSGNVFKAADKKIDEGIKKIYSHYSKDEDICFLIQTDQNENVLLLNYTMKNQTTKFSVKAVRDS
jgi:hypothetical protein